jgi:hypothetical protein
MMRLFVSNSVVRKKSLNLDVFPLLLLSLRVLILAITRRYIGTTISISGTAYISGRDTLRGLHNHWNYVYHLTPSTLL